MSPIENGRVNAADVADFRDWLKTERLPQFTGERLASFLLACDNHLERAKKTLKNYCTLRRDTPEIFTSRSTKNEDVERQLRTGLYAVMPKRTSDNCAILVVQLQDANYRHFDFEAHVKIICMVLDSLVHKDPPDGLVTVANMQGVRSHSRDLYSRFTTLSLLQTGFMHLTKIRLGLVKILARYVQEALPLKMRSVHLFNGGYALSSLFALFKPFLKKEVKDMIHFHATGSDISSFHDTWVAKEFLPGEYGGDLGPVLKHHEATVVELDAMQAFFDEDERGRSVAE